MNLGKNKISRRKALSTGVKVGIAAGVAVVVGAVGGYAGGLAAGGGRITTLTERTTLTKTETVQVGGGQTVTVTKTVTQTGTPTPTVEKVPGATPLERVYNGLKKLIAEGKIQKGTKISILFNPGALGHYQDKYLNKFVEATNGLVEINKIQVPVEQTFSKIITESVEKSGTYDVFVFVPSTDFVEAVESNALYDITDFVAKYDPEILSGPCAYPEQFLKALSFYKGRWWGFPIDYDVWINHYRADIYADKEIRREFEDRYGYPLRPPVTWKEWRDQSEFFYRPEEPPGTKLNRSDTPGFYATWDYKVPFWELWGTLLRWWSTGWPMFDRDMRPTIKKPEVVKAMRDFIEVQKWQPRESYTTYWDVSYPFYQSGKMAWLVSWTSLMKFSSAPDSAVRGMVRLEFCPGYPISGDPDQAGIPRSQVITTAPLATSHTMAVNRYSKNPELAYLFIQYFTSPETSSVNVADPAGYYEPYRQCHFRPAPGIDFSLIDQAWGSDNLRIMLDNLDYFAPDIRLPGKSRYMDVLDKEINAALQGRKSLDDVLNTIESEWNKITDELGRDRQIKLWNEVLDTSIGPKLAPYVKV